MAYCVHCGVKLENGVDTCPLCGTVSVDPMEKETEKTPRTYPLRLPEQEMRRSRRFVLELLACLLLIPAMVCVLLDVLLTQRLSWSIYAAGGLIMLFAASGVPLCVRKHRTRVALLTGYAALTVYLLSVEKVSASGHWMASVVWPALTLALLVALLLNSAFMRKQLNKMTWPGAVLIAMGLECVLVEVLYSAEYTGKIYLFWSLCAFAPCACIALMLFGINRHNRLREEVRRRLHF